MNPPYIELQDPNPVAPPFHFTGMNTQVFPLRAKIDALQQFVDAWLNFLPEEVGRFRAFAPYVNLMLIDYGKMAALAANAGWCSQQEVMFTLPLEWYVVRDGRWVFRDWVWLSPFIFVDNEVSMTLGRTVWGWPKSLVAPLPVSGGVADAASNERVLTRLGTWVYPSLYTGADLSLKPFLEVRQATLPAVFQLPPNPRSPLAPWGYADRFMRSAFGFLTDFQRWGSQFARTSVLRLEDSVLARSGRLLFDPSGGGTPKPLDFQTVNLKQFRSSSSPDEYCYQAVTVAPMRMTAFNRAGLLGEPFLAAGDTSGGFTVELREWPSLPIAETLGLDVASRRTDGDIPVVTLSPVYPYWYDVDMDYNLGDVLAERGPDRRWRFAPRGGDSPVARPPDLPLPAHWITRAPPKPETAAAAQDGRFNTGLGAAGQEMVGPFLFPDMSLRVLPLPANRDTLDEFIDTAMNTPLAGTGLRFTQWVGSADRTGTVYLVASDFGRVASATNDVGSWAEQSVAFLVPVRLERAVEDRWELVSVGVLPAFAHSDNATAAITATEVFGANTSSAAFSAPGVGWMEKSPFDGRSEQLLLEVSSKVTPAVGQGTEVVERLFLQVGRFGADGPTEAPADRMRLSWAFDVAARVQTDKLANTADTDGELLETLLGLAFEPLVRRGPVRSFGLKQFRDSVDPSTACYQSLTMIPQVIEELYEVAEFEGPLFVRLHDYPAMPVVRRLGLIPLTLDTSEGTYCYTFAPQRPFYARLRMRQLLGERLAWRSGSSEWQLQGLPSGWQVGVSGDVCGVMDRGDPSSPTLTLLDWRNRVSPTPELLAAWQAKALEAVGRFGPHSALDVMLSREWGRPRAHAEWAAWLDEKLADLEERLRFVVPARRAPAAWALLQELLGAAPRWARRPLDPDLFIAVLTGVKLADLEAGLIDVVTAEDPALVPKVVAQAAELSTLWGPLQDVGGSPYPKELADLAKLGVGADAALDWSTCRPACTVALMVAGEWQRRLHHQLLVALSKGAQRPDYCALTWPAGAAAAHAFPDDECLGRWFVGASTRELLRQPDQAARRADLIEGGDGGSCSDP